MAYTYDFFLQNPELFRSIKTDSLVTLQCCGCGVEYERTKRSFYSAVSKWKSKRNFCSKQCQGISERDSFSENCKNCGVAVVRANSTRKKTKSVFCTKSCAATYHNKHKTYGTRRSRLEEHVEAFLRLTYPQLEIHCNQKTLIGSELDFYFPQLRLAIEFNGPTHYEPIYGLKKFEQIQNNDKQKFIQCYQLGIELMIVDVSTCKYLTGEKKTHFCDLVKRQIDQLLGRL